MDDESRKVSEVVVNGFVIAMAVLAAVLFLARTSIPNAKPESARAAADANDGRPDHAGNQRRTTAVA